MPDRGKLKIGDKICLLKVPDDDLEQRKKEVAMGIDEAGWTANTIELIIAQNPIVEIDTIDEFGRPWFSCEVMVDGNPEKHTLAINEDDSWRLI
ncbi:MAG: hypothetical protein GYB31_13015 [Bacteroidetes bacterium]|nr:hypothetical protein [Bacteroidota bacterium]